MGGSMEVTKLSPCHDAPVTTMIDGSERCSFERCGAWLVAKPDEPLLIGEGKQTIMHVVEVRPSFMDRLRARAEYVKDNNRIEEGYVKKMQRSEDGTRAIEFGPTPDSGVQSGFGGIPAPEDTLVWQSDFVEGSLIRIFGGLGHEVVGMDVFGQTDQDDVEGDHWIPVYFRPKDEVKQRWAARVADRKVEQATEYVTEGKAKQDAVYASLPDVFQRRIDKYRENNPNWRRDFEPYEAFCLTEAVTIAEHLRPDFDRYAANMTDLAEALHLLDEGKTFPGVAEWFSELAAKSEKDRSLYAAQAVVTAFDKLPYEEQEAAGLSDQHSGNTHAVALKMALLYLAGRDDLIVGTYGALAPLVGSDSYGDKPKEAVA